MLRRSKDHGVEIPVTPMLDMAFQLLTFFILTYRPAPSEGQFAMNLMPAAPAASPDAAPVESNAPPDPSVPAALRTMTTQLYSEPGGRIGRVVIGEVEVRGMVALREKLKAILSDKSLPFDQALIQADPQLRYEELMRVIDVFAGQDLKKISFAELDVAGAGGAP